jgi:hypothetical protein
LPEWQFTNQTNLLAICNRNRKICQGFDEIMMGWGSGRLLSGERIENSGSKPYGFGQGGIFSLRPLFRDTSGTLKGLGVFNSQQEVSFTHLEYVVL